MEDNPPNPDRPVVGSIPSPVIGRDLGDEHDGIPLFSATLLRPGRLVPIAKATYLTALRIAVLELEHAKEQALRAWAKASPEYDPFSDKDNNLPEYKHYSEVWKAHRYMNNALEEYERKEGLR